MAETRNFYPSLQRNSTKTVVGGTIVSYTSDLGDGGPVLTLIHGYPQSSFMYVLSMRRRYIMDED
jgi:hypothetical protein